MTCPRRAELWIAALASVQLFGCRSETVTVPKFSPGTSASEALKSYDRNEDRLLDSGELEQAPGLAAMLKWADKDSDGKLSSSEISERISQFVTDNVAYLPLRCQVLLDDQPLEGATVQLTPEPCVAAAIVGATGTTNTEGLSAPLTDKPELGGVPCGIYRVVVSKKGSGGGEAIPARYNQATTLGLEVALGNRELERPYILRLSSSPAQ